jgi:hypothetical protein
MLGCWDTGMLECWNAGMLGCWDFLRRGGIGMDFREFRGIFWALKLSLAKVAGGDCDYGYEFKIVMNLNISSSLQLPYGDLNPIATHSTVLELC